MDVFFHLVYEIGRGLRDLALHAIDPDQQEDVVRTLELEGIAYVLKPIEDGRVNVYFGHPSCVEVVRSFGACPNCRLSPEQDFILGIMLGYDRARQCERYIDRKERCEAQRARCTLRQARAGAPEAEAVPA